MLNKADLADPAVTKAWLRSFDLQEGILVVEDPKTKSRKKIRFEYPSEGAHVMGVAVAPDGTVFATQIFASKNHSHMAMTDRIRQF